jgi:bleomycin hydrolase
MAFLHQAPVNDGGQWDMAYNIVAKYGIVPKTLYPESFSSSSSGRLNWIVTAKLREYALTLRRESKNGASLTDLRTLKARFMGEVYSTLSIALGTPPKPDHAFTWEYYDKDKKYHKYTGTPREFYHAYGRRKGMDPKDSFSLINDPRNQYEKLYSVKRLGNVWGGPGVRCKSRLIVPLLTCSDVNAPTEVLEDAVIAGIKANTPLFFGCDVGKFSASDKGIMDTALFDLEAAYGYKYGMNKAERLITGESSATHAMVITAVHVDDKGRPVRYKVENSWSKTSGENGWFMMSADWFREYVYQVVVPRSIVDKKWVAVLDQEPTWLEPWDPMGALA